MDQGPNAPPMSQVYPTMDQMTMQHLQHQKQQPLSVYGMHNGGATVPATIVKHVAEQPRPETGSVIMVNTGGPIAFGHEPQRITCPHCNVRAMTRLDFRSTYRTHLMALLCCVTGLICLVPVPYCTKSFKALDHYCSSCDQFVGNSKY